MTKEHEANLALLDFTIEKVTKIMDEYNVHHVPLPRKVDITINPEKDLLCSYFDHDIIKKNIPGMRVFRPSFMDALQNIVRKFVFDFCTIETFQNLLSELKDWRMQLLDTYKTEEANEHIMGKLRPWMTKGVMKPVFNKSVIKIGNPYLISRDNDSQWGTKWVIISEYETDKFGNETIITADMTGSFIEFKPIDFVERGYKIEGSSEFNKVTGNEWTPVLEESRYYFDKEWFDKRKSQPFLVWEYDEDASTWIKRVGFIAPEDINDDNLRILVHKPTENADPHFPFHVPAFDFTGYSVKLVDPNKLHIISVYDLFESMPEKNNNIIVSLQNT